MRPILTCVIALLILAVCSPEAGCATFSRLYSFERGMEGWGVAGTDLDDPPVAWSIRPSLERPRSGRVSLRFYLNNLNDAGKIWIVRPFAVPPNRRVRVTVEYDLATDDFGDVNLWTLITGVSRRPPRTRDDLTYQGHTGNGASRDVGYRWLRKRYSFTTRSDAAGVLYVSVGVWGTWETHSTYYLDNLGVTLTLLP